MANGKLEIDGLKELIQEVNKFKTELSVSVAEMTKLIKVAEDVNSVNLKSVKTLSALNEEQRKQSKFEDESIVRKQKIIDATNKATISAQRLEAQTERLTKAKQKGSQATAGWTTALTSFQAKFNTVGNALAVGFMGAIGGVIGAFQKVIGWNNEFTKALNSLGAITGLRGEDLKALGVQARTTGLAMNMSATEMLGAYEKVGSLLPMLLKNKDALNEVTKQAIILSKASGGSLGLEGATQAVGAVMNQFNLTAAEAAKVVNTLAAAEVEGSATTMDLVESLKNVGAVANNSNMTFEQTSAILEVLASKQILGAEAGTKLRGVILKLQDAGMGYKSGVFNINDALKELKDQINSKTSAQDKDALSLKVFGIENKTAGTILLDNIGLYEELTGKVTNTTTALDQATLQTKSASEEWKKLGLQIEDFFTGDTFEKFNSGVAKFTRATISVLGGLGGTIFETLRFIGEGIYRILDVSSIVSGDYLKNIEKFYDGFQKRMAIRIEWITNPLKEVTDETKKQANLQTKITSDEAKKQEDIAVKSNDKILKSKKEKTKKEFDYEYEKDQKLREWAKQNGVEVLELEKEINATIQEALSEQRQQNFDNKINEINNQYQEELAVANDNQQLIEEAQQLHNERLLQAEIDHWTSILFLSETGSAQYLEAQNTLNDLYLRMAEDTANKKVDIDRKRFEREKEISLMSRQLMIGLAESVGQATVLMATGQKEAAKEALKSMVKMAIQQLKAIAYTQLGIAEVLSLATPDSILTFGASGLARAAAMAALITGAATAAEFGANQVIGGFAKGTKDSPEGFAYVGEQGRELMQLPDGSVMMTPDKATLAYLPEHTEITPAHLVQQKLNELTLSPVINWQNDNEVMYKILSAIENQKTTSINMDSRGFAIYQRQQGNVTKWINETYRC